MAESKYAQISRTYERYMKMKEWHKAREVKTYAKPKPRAKGSEQSYSFKSKGGTRYSDKKAPKKGERRMD